MKVKSESEVTQSCPTPSDPMDCSPPGSSIHGIFQARVLEWDAIAFSQYKTLSDVSQKNDHFQEATDFKLSEMTMLFLQVVLPPQLCL